MSTQKIEPSDVSIVVPIGGAVPAWGRCAESLRRLDPAPGEIIAVIDGADDLLADSAAAIGASVVVLKERGGPARARNRGGRAAGEHILLFVDADVEVPPDLVERIASLFSADQGLAAVMGSYDDAPGDPAFLSQYRNLLHHFVHQTGRERASTFWAGCGAVRRSVFLALGGFDERFRRPSIEDIELGSRLLRAGHSIRLVKDLQVKHLKRWRLRGMLATDLWQRAVPWTELMLAEGQMVNDLNVKVRDRMSVLMAFILLITLSAVWLWPPMIAVSAGAMILLVILNAGLCDFFRRRRGLLFAVGIMPLYWLYLLICGLGFAIGILRHYAGVF